MKYIVIFLALFVYASCNPNSKKDEKAQLSTTVATQDVKASAESKILDSVRRQINALNKNEKNNIIHVFSLDNLPSAEGNEGKAFYTNGKLNKIDIVFFGETGKAKFIYSFKANTVNVEERTYRYNGMLTDVKSDADIKLSGENFYKLDLHGNKLGEAKTSTPDETFLAIMQYVPIGL